MLADYEIVVPFDTLDRETLDRLIAEIVSRDGTDYGVIETTVERRMEQVRMRLQSGAAVLIWNTESESASLLPADQLKR